MLSREQLNTLLRCWEELQLPVVEQLRPGLEMREIDARTSTLGLTLPEEARLWWTWQDGATDAGAEPTSRYIGPGLPLLSLDEAVSLYARLREEAALVWEERADYWWRPTWFPITERRGAIRCDCAVAEGAPTPIYWAYSHDHDERGLTAPRVDSFGTMVDWWIDALNAGAWVYDADSGRWGEHPDRLPPGRYETGLV